MITFACPACGKTFQVKDEDAGRTGRCSCGQPMQVPKPAALPAATKPAPAKSPTAPVKPAASVPQNALPPQIAAPAGSAPKSATPTSATPARAVPQSPAPVKATPASATVSAAPIADDIDESNDLKLAEGEAPPSLSDLVDDIVPPMSSMLPSRKPISDELPDEPKAISGLSSLSAAGLTILLLAATALGSWLYLRQQAPETEKITIAGVPAVKDPSSKPPGSTSASAANSSIDSKPQGATLSVGKTAAGKASAEEPTNKAGNEQKSTGDVVIKQSDKSESRTPEQQADKSAKSVQSASGGEQAATSQTNQPIDAQQSGAATSQATASGTGAAGSVGAVPMTKEDRFKRMISDLKSHREGRQDQSMSIGEAIELCEFYPEHLPKVRFQGCLVHSPTLNESSIQQHYGDPDATTELSDGSINVQGRTFDLVSKPSKMLRYGWLEIYVTNPGGEIWAVKRHAEPPAAQN